MSIPDAPWIGQCEEDHEDSCYRHYDYMDGELDYLIDEAERRWDDSIPSEEEDERDDRN